MIAIVEPIAVGIFVSLWSSLWSKYILPALCAQCEGEDTGGDANSAVSSDVEVHVHSW